MRGDWGQLKQGLPIGFETDVSVSRVESFGFLLRVEGWPEINAVMDRIAAGEPTEVSRIGEGSVLKARVVDHVERTQQVKFRVIGAVGCTGY